MNPGITKIIDQYLANELSAEDKRAFEERLKTNPELQKEVELQRDVVEGVKRASQRKIIKKTKKNYYRSKLLKWGTISLSSIAIIGLISYFVITAFNGRIDPISEEMKALLDKDAQFDNLNAQYFQVSEDGGVVLTEKGVLLSIPKDAFLKDGKPYEGATIVQFQEALDAEDIVTSGLSTMSGDRLLETQGMFSLRSYTKEGDELAVNPDVGVYVQAPVDEYKTGMQLFEGNKDDEGLIDWKNPKPMMKIPVVVDMSELSFYPEEYEPYLDKQKWNQSKKSRDSLYLSFENYYLESYYDYETAEGSAPQRPLTIEERDYLFNDSRSLDQNMTEEEAIALSRWEEGPNYRDFEQFSREYYNYDSLESVMYEGEVVSTASVVGYDVAMPCYILPSKVLAFWDDKFNNTNLATRGFEQRMRAIHANCNNDVLDKYVNQLDKSLCEIDKEIVGMGYPEFEMFVAENMGKVDVNNPHLKNLQSFYNKSVKQLQKKNKSLRNKEKKRKKKWDDKVKKDREKEADRKVYRESQALMEEYQFNMKNVKKQIGLTAGFTIQHGGGTVYNIDKYVWDATVNRESMDRIDPVTGKRAKVTYNDFSFEVSNPDKYIKLFAYVFPHKLNSYQRIEGKNGKFDYPLNDDIIYDIAVVGITEDGYEYFQKQSFKKGELGNIKLKQVSEERMKASIKQLNKKRVRTPMNINGELNWLITERKDYKEQKLRKKMKDFRNAVLCRIFPCMCGSEEEEGIVYH